MLFGNTQLYELTRAAKLGRGRLPRPLEELRHWVSEKYGVNVLTLVYDRIEIGPHEGRPRLNLLVDTGDDYAALHGGDPFSVSRDIKEAVLRRFSEITSASALDSEYDTKGVHLICDDFSDEAMGQAASRFRERDKQRVIEEFAQYRIWKIEGFSKETVVFYLTEKDVQDSQTNEGSQRIKQRCYQLVKQYDEFDYFQPNTFPIRFDSKENLDKNYKGSMFYYFR